MAVDYKLIGKRIKTQRKAKHITQEYLAEKSDLSVGYISQVERGMSKISLDVLYKIADTLDCDITELIMGTSTGQPSYLQDEICSKLDECTEQQKRMVLDFICLLLKYSSL